MTAARSTMVVTNPKYCLSFGVNGMSRTFRISCSVERYSKVKMSKLSHWKKN